MQLLVLIKRSSGSSKSKRYIITLIVIIVYVFINVPSVSFWLST